MENIWYERQSIGRFNRLLRLKLLVKTPTIAILKTPTMTRIIFMIKEILKQITKAQNRV